MTRLLLTLLVSALSVLGFEPARPGYQYVFPRDHFDHPNFQTEWWYYTGNLKTADSRRFGFEMTFFRLGLERDDPAKSPWDIENLYLAHLTLSDIDGGRFYRAERLNRSGPGIAGASFEQGRIWNANWEVRWLDLERQHGTQQLRAVAEDFSLDFELRPAKPPVIHGRDGISRKSGEPDNASHYISFTRLNVRGKLRLQGQDHPVAGTAWMDHEFFSHKMARNQVGWDWMSIQLDNRTELMLYRMRRSDGSADPYSSGTYIDAEGRARHLEASDIIMKPGKTWTSPDTGGKYPIEWSVSIPSLELELDCRTPLAAQEVVSTRQVGPSYWEGAVDYEGTMAGKTIQGVGYLEMTGYDKPIELGETRSR